MELNTQNHKTNKIKNFIKDNHTFFLFNGNTVKSYDWIVTEQALKSMNLKYYKIFNKATVKTLNNSIYQQTKTTINGITFFITPNLKVKSLSKQSLFNNLEPLFFSLISLKFNNKIYSNKQIKSTHSLNYKTNKLLICQFNTTYLKFYYNSSK